MLLYVRRNRRLIRDGGPGRPPRLSHSSWALPAWHVVEVLLYVHRNCRFIRDGSPGRPPRLSRSSWALCRLRLKCCFTSTETVCLLGTGAQDGHLDFHTAPELCLLGLLKSCFTSTETVGSLGTGAQNVHLDFHTVPELGLLGTHHRDITAVGVVLQTGRALHGKIDENITFVWGLSVSLSDEHTHAHAPIARARTHTSYVWNQRCV